jgi:hypothetical protein
LYAYETSSQTPPQGKILRIFEIFKPCSYEVGARSEGNGLEILKQAFGKSVVRM